MIMKTKVKNKIYDQVQRVWVSTCIAVTLASTAFLGYQLFNYFVYYKPIKKEVEERFREELLKEGRMMKEAAQSTNNSYE